MLNLDAKAISYIKENNITLHESVASIETADGNHSTVTEITAKSDDSTVKYLRELVAKQDNDIRELRDSLKKSVDTTNTYMELYELELNRSDVSKVNYKYEYVPGTNKIKTVHIDNYKFDELENSYTDTKKTTADSTGYFDDYVNVDVDAECGDTNRTVCDTHDVNVDA